MSDTTDTKQCTNCKLEIPSSNYTIHSVHCQRNFYLCSKCEQPVNYASKVDHDEANHIVIHCTDCHLALEKYLLDDHLIKDCPEREVKCQICDIEVKATEIAEHENYCGSRTEKCAECGEFVMLKYRSLHLDSNHNFIKLSDEPGPSSSWQYGRRTLCNFMPDLTSKSAKPVIVHKRKSSENFRKSRNSGSYDSKEDSGEISRKNVDSLSSKKDDQMGFKVGNMFEGKDVKKSSKREEDEWPALSTLRSLKISEGKYESPTGTKASISKENLDEESDLFYAMQVSHEINSDVWRKDANSADETLKNSFKPLVENELTPEKFMQKNMFEESTKKVNPESNTDIFRNDFNYLYSDVDKHESVKLPCEFCGNLIVSNYLILHQSRCSPFVTETYTGRSDGRKTFLYDEDLGKKIACGMCNKFFRLSHLENHQLHCQRNPLKSFKNQDKVNYSKNLKTMNMKSEQGLQNGLEPSSPHLTRVGTRSEWLSDLSKSSEGERSARSVTKERKECNKGSHTEAGVVSRGTTKVSRKSQRAPSPPRM